MLVYNHPGAPWAAGKRAEILAVQHTPYGTRYKVSWVNGGGVSGWLNSKDFAVLEVPV